MKKMTDKQKKFAALAPPFDKATQADRIAGATKGDKKVAKGGVRTAIAKIKKAKDGARTGVRGTGAAKRGFRKARLS